MIVRDEAEMLAGCLETAAPAVDEIVILDTGSTDNTRAIARDFGAAIIPAAWTDFSTARNQVLRRATGEWALVLDADEELILQNPDRLRELAASDEADAYSLRIINSVEMTEFIDLEKSPQFFMVRFFKHDGAVYVNPIHERLRLPGGSRIARASGVDIIHYGFMLELFEKKHKAARNRTLLEQWVKDDSGNPWAHFYLGREEERDENFHEAAERYKNALPLFIDNNEAAAVVDTCQSLAKCCLRQGRAEEANLTLGRGVLTIPDSAELRIAYGKLLLEIDKPEAAAEQFGECLNLRGGAISVAELAPTWELLATSLERSGATDKALLAHSVARVVMGGDDRMVEADQPRDKAAAALLARLGQGDDVFQDILTYIFSA